MSKELIKDEIDARLFSIENQDKKSMLLKQRERLLSLVDVMPRDFYQNTEDILTNEYFLDTCLNPHHGNQSTFHHSLEVALASHIYGTKRYKNVDQVPLNRGALLHDFYMYSWTEQLPDPLSNIKYDFSKVEWVDVPSPVLDTENSYFANSHLAIHPHIALENSIDIFPQDFGLNSEYEELNLTEKEKLRVAKMRQIILFHHGVITLAKPGFFPEEHIGKVFAETKIVRYYDRASTLRLIPPISKI